MTTTNDTATVPATGSALTDEDRAAVAAVPGRIVAAWAAHDPDAFAAVFTEDGSMVLPGGVFLRCRHHIRTYMAEAFAGPYQGTRVYGEPVDMRPLGPGAAILITEGGVLAPGETAVARERAVRAAWVLVKGTDGWQLAAYQNTPSN